MAISQDTPREERIASYRTNALRMMRMADLCTSEAMRLAYLRLAAHWQSLVLDLEQSSTRMIDPDVLADLAPPPDGPSAD